MSLGAALIGMIVTLGILAILAEVLEGVERRRSDRLEVPPPSSRNAEDAEL